jgi:hypothetical protein
VRVALRAALVKTPAHEHAGAAAQRFRVEVEAEIRTPLVADGGGALLAQPGAGGSGSRERSLTARPNKSRKLGKYQSSGGSMPTNVSDEMRGALGTLLTRRISYPVAESDIRKWALAVYWPEKPPREFLDAERAPEDFNPFAWAVAGSEAGGRPEPDANSADRTERLAGVPGPGLRFQLNGGLETEYGVPIRPGDVITSENRLDGYSEREGKLGLMLLTVTEDTWTNQDRAVVKRSRMTLIRY